MEVYLYRFIDMPIKRHIHQSSCVMLPEIRLPTPFSLDQSQLKSALKGCNIRAQKGQVLPESAQEVIRWYSEEWGSMLSLHMFTMRHYNILI